MATPGSKVPSAKITVGTSTFVLVGYLVNILYTSIPWLHENIQASLLPQIVILVAAAAGAVAGWLTPHRPTLTELQTALSEVNTVTHLLQGKVEPEIPVAHAVPVGEMAAEAEAQP